MPRTIALTTHGGLIPGNEYYYYEDRTDQLKVYPSYKPKSDRDLDNYDFYSFRRACSYEDRYSEYVLRDSAEYITYTKSQFNLLFRDMERRIVVPVPQKKKVFLCISKQGISFETLYFVSSLVSKQAIAHLACIDAYLTYMGTDYYAKFGYSLSLLCKNASKASDLKDQKALDLAVKALNDLFETLKVQISPLLLLEEEEANRIYLDNKKQEQEEMLANLMAISSFYNEIKTSALI